MKTVMDFLKTVDALCPAVFWMRGEDTEMGPCWKGALIDTPWWVAELELDYEEAGSNLPIVFVDNLGEDYNNKPGFVFQVKEKED